MIHFDRFVLDNGLRVIFHQDDTTPMVAVNILYDVGARDEHPDKTGFAHLFEHLMFGGSVNIPNYDEPLQMAGGENNAYTTNDFTNYYIQLPKENIETALWLESDRMISLAFSKDSLAVQKKVVCEEFKEGYINQPYGDASKELRSMCYQVHPYQWMTIGKELSHIENASLDDVVSFFHQYYHPSNAILSIAGNINNEEVKLLVQKWFGNIPSGKKLNRHLPKESKQIEAREKTVTGNVTLNAIYKAWIVPERTANDFHAMDIITEVLSNGQTSRLYEELVKQQRLFSTISCYHTGSLDEGLLIIEGKVAENVDYKNANIAIENEVQKLMNMNISNEELSKAQHKIESMITFEDMSLIAKANNLAFYELLGDAGQMNTELSAYLKVDVAEIRSVANKIFKPQLCNTLFYLKDK